MNEKDIDERHLNLDLISQHLLDKLCAIKFDLDSIGRLLKLTCTALERIDPHLMTQMVITTKHRVCQSISICYFCLLEYESDNFPEVLSYIRISLTCMSLLKQSIIASHMLCRALIDRSLVYGHLFNKNFDPDSLEEPAVTHKWTTNDPVKLSQENLKINYGNRFRRLPNYDRRSDNVSKRKNDIGQERGEPKQQLRDQSVSNECDEGKPDKQSINSYLLIEAFKSSINNMEDFANLFVECHCPVTFDKLPWSTDETLRLINEKNLSILKRFNQIPPLWDLFEVIGEAECLKFCLPLVKSLLAAHLALWASATTDSCPNKMISTSRLIPPLAKSQLVPPEFAYTVEVFPHLSASEIHTVLSDVWHYLKDTNVTSNNLAPEEKLKKAKACMHRLRIFMCQNTPGPLYVKMFKNYYTP